MARSTDEWVGKTDDSAAPARVRARVVDRAGGRCECCGAQFTPALRPEIDHTIALILGGENRESNLRALCKHCHRPKTDADVAMKAKIARVRAKHLGLKPATKRPVGGGLAAKFKRMPDGRVVPR